MQHQDPDPSAISGDHPHVRPMIGIPALGLFGSIQAERGEDGVWSVPFREDHAARPVYEARVGENLWVKIYSTGGGGPE